VIDALRQGWQRVRSFFAKEPLDRDLDAEMAAHLEFAIEENMQQGMAAEEARRRALIRFGGVVQAKEQHRETRGLPWLDILMQDLRYTFRTLRKDRAFTMVAVLILALGIGANVAVFSVVDTILLRPLPFGNPQRLTWIADLTGKSGASSQTYSVDAYDEFRSQNHSFQDVTGYFAFSSSDNYKLTGNGEPRPLSGIMVAGNFFQTLQVTPSVGRLFTEDELRLHGRPAVLLIHSFWQRQYGGDPAIVGKAIDLDGTPTTVIGVLPEQFDFGSVFSPGARIDIITPAIMDDIRDEGNTLSLIGRLKPGVTLVQAQDEANTLFPKLHFSLKHPEWGGGYKANIVDLKQYVSGKLQRSLIVLWCAVGLIMLIVCVNLSNLLLARAASRNKEFAMRQALGAGRGRLLRQLLTESLVLSGAGAVLGLGFAYAIVFYMAHQGSIALPLLSSVRVDGSALAWTLMIAVAAAVLVGLAPAFRMSGKDLQESLKDSGTTASQGRRHDRMRAALVISEVALACVLMIGAGLLLRSFLRVLDVDLGFQPAHAASIQVDYNNGGSLAKGSAVLQNILHRVQMLPGIETAGITDNLPLDRNRSWGLRAKGRYYAKEDQQSAFVYIVTPGYLNAMGMRLREGRDVNWDDTSDKQQVAIINDTVARQFWPGQDPIDRIVLVNGKDARVIGVIADVRESGAEAQTGWQMYLPVTQQWPDGAELVVRTKLPPDALASAVMATLRSINPEQPATEFRPVQQLVDHAVSPRRFFVVLVATFAGLGLLLASLGIYGVISYSVTQQTKEIGIRMALGATAGRVQFGVIRRTLTLAVMGIALGGALSLGLARMIASLLFGTTPTDPMTFTAMAILLGLVAFVAGYLPARRASKVDPLVALRTN
jgi:predicted permease